MIGIQLFSLLKKMIKLKNTLIYILLLLSFLLFGYKITELVNTEFKKDKIFKIIKKEGYFNSIEKKETSLGIVYILIKENVKIRIPIYREDLKLNGKVNLIINENQKENSYKFNFKQNNLKYYGEGLNSIIINLTTETTLDK